MTDTPTASTPVRALLAGATGVVGRELLQRLLDDPQVGSVHALVRRPLALQHPKLHPLVVDFARLPPLPAVDEAYLALGTTLAAAGSQEAFRAVDLDMNLAVARAALAAGATRLGLVSAADANARSRAFYNRVKGELEDALRALAPPTLVLAQPSLLLDDRRQQGQPARLGETLAIPLARLIGRWLPGRYRPVQGAQVAQALVQAVRRAKGILVLPSDRMAAQAPC